MKYKVGDPVERKVLYHEGFDADGNSKVREDWIPMEIAAISSDCIVLEHFSEDPIPKREAIQRRLVHQQVKEMEGWDYDNHRPARL